MDCVIAALMMKLYFTVENDECSSGERWSVHFGERKEIYFLNAADYPSVSIQKKKFFLRFLRKAWTIEKCLSSLNETFI